jgi:Leucine-rich repeat (LRR) protein
MNKTETHMTTTSKKQTKNWKARLLKGLTLILLTLTAGCGGNQAMTPKRQQHVVRDLLEIPIYGPDTCYDLQDRVQCDAQGNVIGLGLLNFPPTGLPPEIWQLDHLQKLNLCFLQLTSLPPEIGELTNLRVLDLCENRLTSLPSDIWQLTNLQALDLSSNQLTTLPPEIGQLTNLQFLDLGENQLTSLPPELGQLDNLQWLDLSNNPLTNLSPELCAKLGPGEINPPSLCP